MSFRFRRSARSRGAHATVGLLPGTGLSRRLQNSTETVRPGPAQVPDGPAEGLLNSLRFRSSQLDSFKQGCLSVLQEQLFAPGSQDQLLWEPNLVTRLLVDPTIGSRTQGLLAVIEMPKAMVVYMMRAQSQDDAKRRAHSSVEATQKAARLVNDRGWLKAADLPRGTQGLTVHRSVMPGSRPMVTPSTTGRLQTMDVTPPQQASGAH